MFFVQTGGPGPRGTGGSRAGGGTTSGSTSHAASGTEVPGGEAASEPIAEHHAARPGAGAAGDTGRPADLSTDIGPVGRVTQAAIEPRRFCPGEKLKLSFRTENLTGALELAVRWVSFDEAPPLCTASAEAKAAGTVEAEAKADLQFLADGPQKVVLEVKSATRSDATATSEPATVLPSLYILSE